MGFMKKMINQTRKPQGIMGKMMINSMNSGHSKMASWGVGHLDNITPSIIVDLGCGGGKNVQEFLKKYPQATVTGVDYSDMSVEMTQNRNNKEIEKGRCIVQQGDVSNLDFESEKYDLATAFETIYFWPGPVKSFQEVYRILKPHGYFLIVNETDGTNEKDQRWEEMIEGMKIYTETEIQNNLEEAGFRNIQVFHNHKKFWIGFLAQKN